MWQPKEPGVGMKPEAPGKARKRKHQDASGTETESDAVGRSTNNKREDGTEMVFKEPGKAWKKTPREHQDLELQRDRSGKGQAQTSQEDNQRQGKPLEYTAAPPELAERKPADCHKGRKRPYSFLEEKEQSPPKEKHGRILQHRQRAEDPHPDPHRPQPKTSKMKGGVSGHSHASETSQNHQEPATPDKREGRCSQEKSLTPALISLDSGGGDRILPKQTAVLAAEKDHRRNVEKSRQVDPNFHVTEDMDKEIKSALGPGPQEEILSNRFKLQITRRDIHTLRNGQWLNDEVINFYMNLLVERNENQGYPALHAFSTFFYPKLKQSGYTAVKRWTRGINLFDKELLLVPIHQRVHWSLVVIDLRKQSIVYLDSRGQSGKTICETIFEYLQNESKTRRDIELDPLQWKQYSMTAEEIPQQLNGSDCGMFTCKYADYIARDQPVTFSQQHMPIFRKRMVWEILHSHLL